MSNIIIKTTRTSFPKESEGEEKNLKDLFIF
jgi:hypothetical protein